MKSTIYILSLFLLSFTIQQTQDKGTIDYRFIEEKMKTCLLSNNRTSIELKNYIEKNPNFDFNLENCPFEILPQDKYIFRECKNQFDERTLRTAGAQKKIIKAAEMKKKLIECVEEFENRSEELEEYLVNYKKEKVGKYYYKVPFGVEDGERKVVGDCRKKIEGNNGFKRRRYFRFGRRNRRKRLMIFDDDDDDDYY